MGRQPQLLTPATLRQLNCWCCLIAAVRSSPFSRLRRSCRVHGCLRGQHRLPHDGASREELSKWTTHSVELTVQHQQRNSSAPRPDRTFQALRSRALCGTLCCKPGIRIKEFTVLEHRVHDHRQLAGHSHGSSFKADALLELEPPSPEAAVGQTTS